MERTPAVPDRLRVTITSGIRGVDLVLPSAVPVTELLPELAWRLGVLDAATAHAGFRLVTLMGRELSVDGGLHEQGVEDGEVLTLSAPLEDPLSRVYDDLAEAVAAVAERDLPGGEAAAARWVGLGAAGLLLLLGAAAAFLWRSTAAGTAAALTAALLVSAAIVVSRVHHDLPTAVFLAWTAGAYAAVAALLVAHGDALLGLPTAYAGASVTLVGAIAMVGVDGARAPMIPEALLGLLLLAGGVAVDVAGRDAAMVVTAMQTLLVAAGGLFPWLSLAATGMLLGRLGPTSAGQHATRIEPSELADGLRLAHELLVGMVAAVGVLLVLASPVMVSLGSSGLVLALMCCSLVCLRTRQHRSHQLVLVGLSSGAAGAVAVAVSVLWLHPGWRPGATAGLVAVGGALLLPLVAPALAPRAGSARWGRLGDLAEALSLVALLPTLLVATGVVAAFVSGAGEVERVHSGRCLVGGLLLSLVLLGGAAVADEVSPYLPEDLGLGQTANEGADPAPSR